MSPEGRHRDYRSLLLDEYEVRRQLRRQFSRSSFARFLGLSRSHFSELLKGRSGLSMEKALNIAQKLQLSTLEEKFFVSSIQAEHGRTELERKEAGRALEQIRSQQVSVVQLDLFSAVSQWQHFAILELSRLQDFRLDERWIAERLGISAPLARESLERLMNLGLLKVKEGKASSHKGLLKTTDDIPSRAVKAHHLEILNLARSALYHQDVNSREFTSLMVAFDADKLAAAKKRIREFQAEMSDLLTTSSKKRNALYCFAMQFFSLIR